LPINVAHKLTWKNLSLYPWSSYWKWGSREPWQPRNWSHHRSNQW
jgi:hypothetical protein